MGDKERMKDVKWEEFEKNQKKTKIKFNMKKFEKLSKSHFVIF